MGLELARVEVAWSGAGVNGLAFGTHYYAADDSDPDPAAISTAYLNLRPLLSSGTFFAIANSGDVIDDADGHLVRTWSGTGGGSTNGTAAFNPAAGVGACVGWLTGVVVAGHRLNGRTFIVPLATSMYDATGTLSTTCITALEAWATAMMTTGPLGIWHRPTSPGGTDGTSHGVSAWRIRDKVAFLSSRRD